MKDVREAKDDEEYENAKTIKSKKYKTSMLYGTKLMVLPKDVYGLLIMYIDKIRPILTSNYAAEDKKLGTYLTKPRTLPNMGDVSFLENK